MKIKKNSIIATLILSVLIIMCLASCDTSTTNNEKNNVPTTCVHSWSAADCTLPKICSKCGETEGKALGHSWEDATCNTPKTCSKCGETEGNIGKHIDSGNGRCKYCNQDILLMTLKEGFDVRLIIPTVGGMNGYCTVKYTNETEYTISGDMSYLSANGKLLYNSSAQFTLQPGCYVTKTHYRAILESERYSSKWKDLYLDNNSLAYTNVQVEGKTVFVRFGTNGPIAFGYSLADIDVY